MKKSAPLIQVNDPKEPRIWIHPLFVGTTELDLLTTIGFFSGSSRKDLLLNDCPWFHVTDHVGSNDFAFASGLANSKGVHELYCQRNETVAILPLQEITPLIPDNADVYFELRWNHAQITICLAWGDEEELQRVVVESTKPVRVPMSTITYARKKNLLPVTEYNTLEEFWGKVLSCFKAIPFKIAETNNYYSFWNNENGVRKPKNETEVQPNINCLLSDVAMLSSFEVSPEVKTGVGNLDFLITAKLKNSGLANVCVEVKNAHSQDLLHGVTHQLPAYMENKSCQYGIYIILDYYCEWFFPEKKKRFYLDLEVERFESGDPVQSYIKVIVFHLGKPKTASKQ